MKKYLLFIPLLCLLGAEAQTVFLPNIGTTWHYLFKYDPTNEERTNKITYLADSIEPGSGEKIKILTSDKLYFMNNYPGKLSKRIFIKQRNDSILLYHSQDPKWHVIIDFNATIGQKWEYYFESYPVKPASDYYVKVMATGTVNINNQILKKMDVKYFGHSQLADVPTFTSTIYERFGDVKFLFPFYRYKDLNYPNKFEPVNDSVITLLCYEDNTLGLKQFTNMVCNFNNPLGINSQTASTSMSVWPNPTATQITVEFNEIILERELVIKTMLGKEVIKRTKSEDLRTQIDVSNLSKGIYFLQLWEDGKLITSQKLIKQ
jgi:hypothetical protein